MILRPSNSWHSAIESQTLHKICLTLLTTILPLANTQFATSDIFGGTQQNNNQFPQSGLSAQDPFTTNNNGGINSNQNGQGSIFTGFEGRGPGQQASIRQQLRFTDPDFDWKSYDRRSDDQWWHLYGFGERFYDQDLSDFPGSRPWLDRQIDLDFFLPFYGYRFNYSFIFPEGFVSFSYPHYIQPPYTFPSPNWPDTPDPSFIAAFMTDQTFMAIGEHRISHVWYRILSKPPNMVGRANPRPSNNPDEFGDNGIFQGRTFQGQLLRTQKGRLEDPEFLIQLSKDIRDGQVGARGFEADYALVVTWERMAYGGSPRYTQLNLYGEVRRWQNTYQMVIATDEVRTFVMYNYANINWTSSTSAGALFGRGGKQSAIVGFNGGNGTGFTELPYSAEGNSYKLVQFGATPVAGRWQARIDEKIIYGGCTNTTIGKLSVQPPYYDMLGGTPINVSGPCFRPTDRLKLQVDVLTLDCERINIAKAKCLIPVFSLWVQGPQEIKLSIDGGKTYPFFSNWYIVPPHRGRTRVRLLEDPVQTENSWYNPDAPELTLRWNRFNISSNPNARININLYGYTEDTLSHELTMIGRIATGVPNNGVYEFKPSELWTNDLDLRNSDRYLRDESWKRFHGGAVNVRVDETQWEDDMGDLMYWSPNIGFSWYFKPKWEYEYGADWGLHKCIEWFEYDGRRQNFVMDLEPQVPCPCMMGQALADFGRWAPYESCDMDGNSDCFGINGASHCVISTQFVWTGAAQVCCYENDGYLMFSDDFEYGTNYLDYYGAGTSIRAHPWGTPPFRRPPFVPTMSNFAIDLMPSHLCCSWTDHCELYYWRRPTSGCQLYRPPTVGYTYGLGHFVTFDGTEYNFPGHGYFVLSKLQSPIHDLMVQVRMEVPEKTNWDQYPAATVITGLAASDNGSSKVEIFARKNFRRWRYRMDVYVDGIQYFFDMPFKLIYNFGGVNVRTPLRSLDMGIIEIMFSTGVGIRVQEYKGALAITMSMPPNYNISVPYDYIPNAQRRYAQQQPGDYDDCNKAYQTMGLLGTFNNNPDDDLMSPQPGCQRSTVSRPPTESQLQSLYTNFGNKWLADGVYFKILFGTYSKPLYNPRLFTSQTTKWVPEFVVNQNADQNLYRDLVFTLDQVKTQCQGILSCIYDYYQTGVREIGMRALQYDGELASVKDDASIEVTSCGPLQKNRGVLKYPQFDNYLDGRTVVFACQPEFFLHGDTQRTCVNGTWTPGWWPWCRDRGLENFLKWLVGLGTSFLIILIIAAVFFGCYYRRVSEEKQMRYINRPITDMDYGNYNLDPVSNENRFIAAHDKENGQADDYEHMHTQGAAQSNSFVFGSSNPMHTTGV